MCISFDADCKRHESDECTPQKPLIHSEVTSEVIRDPPKNLIIHHNFSKTSEVTSKSILYTFQTINFRSNFKSLSWWLLWCSLMYIWEPKEKLRRTCQHGQVGLYQLPATISQNSLLYGYLRLTPLGSNFNYDNAFLY